jgi:hypothetical protein
LSAEEPECAFPCAEVLSVLKALVISDDAGRLKDLGDVLAVARAEGKKLFHTDENVAVVYQNQTFIRGKLVYIVVVESSGCSGGAVVAPGKHM